MLLVTGMCRLSGDMISVLAIVWKHRWGGKKMLLEPLYCTTLTLIRNGMLFMAPYLAEN